MKSNILKHPAGDPAFPVNPAQASLVLRLAEEANAAEDELWAVVECLAIAGESAQVAAIAARRRTAAAIDVLGWLS